MHESLEPEQITSLLKICPTQSWRKGDLIEAPGGIAPASMGTWMLMSTHLTNGEIQQHLEWLLALILPLESELRLLRNDGYYMDVWCDLSAELNAFFELSPKVLSGFARLDLKMDFSVSLQHTLKSEQERDPEGI